MMSAHADRSPDWVASSYHQDALVQCTVEDAWSALLDFESWNPEFAGTSVTRLKGDFTCEGSQILIRYPEKEGEDDQGLLAEVVRITPQRQICWYMRRPASDTLRNFIDYQLIEQQEKTLLLIGYYAQERILPEALTEQSLAYTAVLGRVSDAFRRHCEERISCARLSS